MRRTAISQTDREGGERAYRSGMIAGQLRDVKHRPHRGLIKQTCSSEKALRPPDATGSRPQYGFKRRSSRVITAIIVNSRDICQYTTNSMK